MWTGRADRTGWRRAAVTLLLAACLTACSAEGPGRPGDPGTQDQPGRAEQPAAGAAADVVTAVDRALADRAAAVRRSDRRAFLAGLDHSDPAFVAEQRAYFANLGQLPLARFGYATDPSTLVRDGDGYWVTVDVTTQLEDFDRRPSVVRDRYLVTRGQGGRFRLASVADEGWELENEIAPQPWDLGEVTVRRGERVLVVLDPAAAQAGTALTADVESALAAVSAEVPYRWGRRAVVYALTDPTYLDSLDALPTDDALALDAVTVPVLAASDSPRVVGSRVVLNPSLVTSPGAGRSRLLRHELTHVALGLGAGGVPLWLDEGLAEYVSVQPLAPEDRAVPGAALDAAEAGLTRLPDDSAFASDVEVSYAVGWWACELVADRYGEATLWALLDEVRGGGEPEAVLQDLLGIDEQRLAEQAGELMLATYRPGALTGRAGRRRVPSRDG